VDIFNPGKFIPVFSGIQATCPMNDTRFFKPIDTPCNLNTALCDRGECNKSICTLIGRTECTLTIPNVAEPLRQRDVDREYLCHIGCSDGKESIHFLRMSGVFFIYSTNEFMR
jgi:hypothetical protein